jgi:hypothetical protein
VIVPNKALIVQDNRPFQAIRRPREDYCRGGGGNGDGCAAGGAVAETLCDFGLGGGAAGRRGGLAGCSMTTTGLGANVGGGLSKSE